MENHVPEHRLRQRRSPYSSKPIEDCAMWHPSEQAVLVQVKAEARCFLLLQAPIISVRDCVEAGLLDGLLQRRVD
eukprot:2313328-Heterocapsa_arctica.AAC.1